MSALGLAAVGGISGGIQALAAEGQNRKSRRFQREMFDKTNTYNSPLEQRKRLEEAGLNPNLVYGGSSGQTAGEASQPAKPDFNVPEWGKAGEAAISGGMAAINAQNVKSTTTLNEERTEETKQDVVNKGLDAVNKQIQNAGGMIDYETKKRLFDTNIKTAQEKLNNLSVDTGYKRDKNVREERITDETIKKLRAETSGASEDAIRKKIDNQLYKKYNIRPSDPMYMRIFGNIWERLQQSRNKFNNSSNPYNFNK